MEAQVTCMLGQEAPQIIVCGKGLHNFDNDFELKEGLAPRAPREVLGASRHGRLGDSANPSAANDPS